MCCTHIKAFLKEELALAIDDRFPLISTGYYPSVLIMSVFMYILACMPQGHDTI